MKTTLALSALGALALASGIAIAAGQPDRPEPPKGDMTRAQATQMANEHFDRMDANKDGKLDPADREAVHARMAAEMFDRLDTNRDGSISRDEWNAGAARMAQMHARGGPGMGGRPMMRHMKMMMADADGDRTISRDEFVKRALDHFDRADANRDGKISAQEREQAHAAMRERFERK